jgi:hypothetical protein
MRLNRFGTLESISWEEEIFRNHTHSDENYGVIMIAGIRQKTIVKDDGKIEISSSELQPGSRVEVIVFLDLEEQDTTEYLLSTQANREHLY